MRRLLLVSLLSLIGCASIVGPRKRDARPERVDPPGLPIPEQKQRARADLPYPDPNPWLGPRNFAEIPEQQWGQRSH